MEARDRRRTVRVAAFVHLYVDVHDYGRSGNLFTASKGMDTGRGMG